MSATVRGNEIDRIWKISKIRCANPRTTPGTPRNANPARPQPRMQGLHQSCALQAHRRTEWTVYLQVTAVIEDVVDWFLVRVSTVMAKQSLLRT
jgi:hypothetical protein